MTLVHVASMEPSGLPITIAVNATTGATSRQLTEFGRMPFNDTLLVPRLDALCTQQGGTPQASRTELRLHQETQVLCDLLPVGATEWTTRWPFIQADDPDRICEAELAAARALEQLPAVPLAAHPPEMSNAV